MRYNNHVLNKLLPLSQMGYISATLLVGNVQFHPALSGSLGDTIHHPVTQVNIPLMCRTVQTPIFLVVLESLWGHRVV
jgi:hypothetical protein